MPTAPESPLDDITALQAALVAERLARQEAEARATSAETMVAHLKLLIPSSSMTASAPPPNAAAS